MLIHCVWEHNGDDSLLYAADFPGAGARGETQAAALAKIPEEIRSYCRWAGLTLPAEPEPVIVQEKPSGLNIRDADSDVLFESEKGALPPEEYDRLKALCLRSASDFLALYGSVPDREKSCLPQRETFYGRVPRTAEEMYLHTKNVNAYYFGEIGVEADNEGDILSCRERGFALLERQHGFLQNPVVEGSYGEEWSLKKVLRRFLWHDRIHARAMCRMAAQTFGPGSVPDPFCFSR